MSEPVQFFAHTQIAGEWTKAIEVQKIDTPELEGLVEHPNFSEIRDNFTITCRYKLIAIDETLYDLAEVRRIIKTVFSPQAGNGTFWQVTHTWANDDQLDKSDKLEIRRILSLTLIQIKSSVTSVFRGFNGVLTFDTSASSADSKPASDYIFTEVENVIIQQGYRTIPAMTTPAQSGGRAIGVPVYFRGMFSGRFTCEMWAKKEDVTTTTFEALDNIYKAQAKGELGTAVFLHANTNQEGTPVTLTETVTVQITSITKTSGIEALLKYRIEGTILEPTSYLVA